MKIEADDESFRQEVLESGLPVMVDFWATWCGPCRLIAPVVEELAEEYSGRLKVIKVNVDNSPATAADYGIMSIPTLKFFKNGAEVESIVGVRQKDFIKACIEKMLIT